MLWQDEMLNYELFFYINKVNHTNNHWPRWLYVYNTYMFQQDEMPIINCLCNEVFHTNNHWPRWIYMHLYMYVPTCQCLKC